MTEELRTAAAVWAGAYLVAVGAYTALALVFAAKGIVRVDKGGSGKASYYILGTLANFTWALVVALAAVVLTRLL